MGDRPEGEELGASGAKEKTGWAGLSVGSMVE